MKLITTIITTALLTIATAQTTQTQAMTLVFANNTDGTIINCPQPFQGPDFTEAHCFKLNTTLTISKLELNLIVTKYNDLNWAIPWEEITPDIQSRMMIYRPSNNNPQTYGIFVYQRQRTETIIMFLPLDD